MFATIRGDDRNAIHNNLAKNDLRWMGLRRQCEGQKSDEAAKFCVWAVGSMQDDCIQRVVDWCTKANSHITPRKSALEKGTTEGGYSSTPMRLFKDVIFPTARCEPRVPSEVYKAVSDSIQACQLSGADPEQTAEQGSEQIDSFLAGYSGAPLV